MPPHIISFITFFFIDTYLLTLPSFLHSPSHRAFVSTSTVNTLISPNLPYSLLSLLHSHFSYSSILSLSNFLYSSSFSARLFYLRISATLKARWEDPEFREKMLTRSFERTDEWRALVSDRIRAKWSDPEYRAAVAVGESSKR